jgi:hypothetical protein
VAFTEAGIFWKWAVLRYAALRYPTTMWFEEFQGKIKGGAVGPGLTARYDFLDHYLKSIE